MHVRWALWLLLLGWVEGLAVPGEISWTLSAPTNCQNLPDGCACSGDAQRPQTISVLCQCSPHAQTALLVGGESREVSLNELSWEVRSCSKVVLYRDFLSAIFRPGRKLRLSLKFSHISNLTVEESAFEMRELDLTRVEIASCGLDFLPTKAFPSVLSSLRIRDSTIGYLAPRFIHTLRMEAVVFENTSIGSLRPNAFYRDTLINSLTALHSTVKEVEGEGISSAINNLTLTSSLFERIASQGINAKAAAITLTNSSLQGLEEGAFRPSTWTSLNLQGNSFSRVKRGGLDLSQSATETREKIATLRDNTFSHAEPDFLLLGDLEEEMILLGENTFMDNCTCGERKVQGRLPGAQAWFLDSFFGLSRCSLGERERRCFKPKNRTQDGFVLFPELKELCEESVWMCTQGVSEMKQTGGGGYEMRLPNRLQMLAFMIGAFVLFMVVSLLITLVVYLLRRAPKKEGKEEEVRGKGDFLGNKVEKTPSVPTRLALLQQEDVEMEDKGVQTLPTDLSAEILEGLREKLSKPDTSFRDAKETLDHLYDLIQVRERESKSSLNNLSESSASPQHRSVYAQVGRRRSPASISPSGPPPPLPTSPPPPLCDYTEPRDFQTHIYAELLAPPLPAVIQQNPPGIGIPPSPIRRPLPVPPPKPKPINTHIE